MLPVVQHLFSALIAVFASLYCTLSVRRVMPVRLRLVWGLLGSGAMGEPLKGMLIGSAMRDGFE